MLYLSMQMYFPYCPDGIVLVGMTGSSPVWAGGTGSRIQQEETQVGHLWGTL